MAPCTARTTANCIVQATEWLRHLPQLLLLRPGGHLLLAALKSSSARMEGLYHVKAAHRVVLLFPVRDLVHGGEHAVAAPSVVCQVQDEGMACKTTLEFSLRQVEVV